MIYLDNASTTKISDEVLEEMMPYLKDSYGNPGNMHKLGAEANRAIEKAREQVSSFIGASPEQIVFTSGGTESNNMALQFAVPYMKKKFGIANVLSGKNEHDSILRTLDLMEEDGVGQLLLETNEFGEIDTNYVESVFTEYGDVGLASFMYVNNESGAINDVRKLASICREYGALFHTDCVQAAGTLPLDVNDIMCDMMSVSSHKIHGPKGVGALYLRRPEFKLSRPLIAGGLLQEYGLRGGTENVAGIVGFGKACEIAARDLEANNTHISLLKQIFYTLLREELEEIGMTDRFHVNGTNVAVMRKGKILSLRFDGVDAETLTILLSGKGVCCSAGSACRSHEQEPSNVLLAMGLTPEQARCSVRFSFSEYNTEEEVNQAAHTVSSCVKILSDAFVK